MACLVAVSANGDGRREILGLDVVVEEDGAGWLAFLRSLRARGLKSVELVISDAHPGLKDAIASVLRGAAWQRCRTHSSATCSPRRAHRRATAAALCRRGKDAGGRREILAFAAFPKEHWRQIWSNNPQERLTARSAGAPASSASSPTARASSALVGAVLCELNDDLGVVRRYMTIEKREEVAEQRVLAKKTAA